MSTPVLMPSPRQRFFDSIGLPLVRGYVFTFVAGTSDPLVTFTDPAGLIPNTNPIILDDHGEANIYWLGNYKVDVRDEFGLQVRGYPVDNFNAENATQGVAQTVALLASPAGSSTIGFLQSGSGAQPRTVQDKERDQIGPQDFAGNPDVAFASAVAEVGQKARILDMGGRTTTLSAAMPPNQFGVPIRNGKVLVPSKITGSVTQLNTYADDVNGLHVGRENMMIFKRLVTLGPNKVQLFGDSTVELGPGWPVKAHELFQMSLQDAGANDTTCYNRGKGGTSWSDLDALPWLAPDTYLFIIKYGINDAVKSNPLATFMADARAKLSAIRSSTYGGVNSLSILLVGPSSTYHPSNNQDAKWYEGLRNCYLQLCKEFDCAYFDMYALMQSTKNAPGIWMDDLVSLGSPGEGLHYDQIAIYHYWRAGIGDFVLGNGGWNPNKSNTFWNLTNFTKPAMAVDFPNTYPRGIQMQMAQAANGWPFDGVIRTEGYADGTSVQTLSTVDVVPRTATRRGTGGVWAQWAGIPVPITVFSNGWAVKGSGFAAPGYQVQSDGFIELFGHISSGTVNTLAFTLPSNAWPASGHVFKAANNATVNVFANGQVTVNTTDNTMVGLGGIRFKAL